MSMTHFGDPCIHCSIPHDYMPPGPCLGDLTKVIPLRFRDYGPRAGDGRRHLLVLYSDGSFADFYLHAGEPDPWSLRAPPVFDDNLRRPGNNG